jgi:hypothetical protein
MTVKELKEILDACNDNAEILVSDMSGTGPISPSAVWATTDGFQVIIDPTIVDEE